MLRRKETVREMVFDNVKCPLKCHKSCLLSTIQLPAGFKAMSMFGPKVIGSSRYSCLVFQSLGLLHRWNGGKDCSGNAWRGLVGQIGEA